MSCGIGKENCKCDIKPIEIEMPSDRKADLEFIKGFVSNYVKKYKIEKEEWEEGEWVAYSGPVYDEKEYLAAIETLLDGWLILGQNGREFEKQFPSHLGCKHGILTNSGSSANLLMMSVAAAKDGLNLPRGSKVITPVVCFPTTLNPILQVGFEPVFVDVTLPSLNLDLDEVERKLEEDPEIKAIVFAHVLGNPPDMDRVMNLVDKYNLILLEDCCDALGTTYKGKKLGSFGKISTCSFFPAHHMTMGEGGFVATDSGRLAKVLASFRDWGRDCYCNQGRPGNVIDGSACGDRHKAWLPDLPEVEYDHRYVFSQIGYNLKPLDLQAAMGLEQLKKLPEMEEYRKKNFEYLLEVFRPYEQFFHLPEPTNGADVSWFAFLLTIREDAPFTRKDLTNWLESRKIQTRSYFAGNVLYHTGYRHLQNGEDMRTRFPVAHAVTTNSMFLGTFSGLTENKLKYIKESVDDFMKGR